MKSRKMLKSRVSSIIREFFCDLFALFRVKEKKPAANEILKILTVNSFLRQQKNNWIEKDEFR